MLSRVSETMVIKRKWNSFVCPGCRFVFRVPRDHDGRGTVCPSCRSMLRLPEEGETTLPLVRIPNSAPEPLEEEVLEPDLEDQDGEEGESSSVLMLVSMAIIGGSLLVGFAFWLKSRITDQPPPVAIHVPITALPGQEKENKEDKEIVSDATGLIKEVEPILKGFLNAPTMDQALKFVHEPDRVRRRWSELLKGDVYEKVGFVSVDEKSIAISPGMVSLRVTLGDYSNRVMPVRLTPQGPRIDWESWAGWSEMSWEAFRKQRPTEPKLFRVISGKVDYYNFSFKDDTEWSSYRLDSADGEHSIYGYVPATGELDARLRPSDPKKRSPMILKLRFPANAPTDSQVIIDSIVAEGWVDH